MNLIEGKFSVETFAKKCGLSRQSAINKLSKLKKKGFVKTSGGGAQKRIYTISKIPRREPNGLFTILNRHSPEKINPDFEHHVYGNYRPEHALIDGIRLIKEKKDVRLKEALFHLFRHVNDWKLLFNEAKQKNVVAELQELYSEARQKTKVKTMPWRYQE
jgi:hypothetical protein